MHLPLHNVETRPAALHNFIRQNPLGILTTSIRSTIHPTIQSSHIPWVLDSNIEVDSNSLGRLRGHIARSNPQAQAIIESLTDGHSASPSYLADDVLILFNGPVHHYVTPKFYKETKPNSGKVVPTWDYEAVQVYGKAKIYYDSRAADSVSFLKVQLADLSQESETSIMGYGMDGKSRPWKVSDAPDPYIQIMMKNIIGIEVEITSMAGRFKWSQEKPRVDREGVIEGFRGIEGGIGEQLADKAVQAAAKYDNEKMLKKQGS